MEKITAFTFVEVIIALGILAVIFGLGLPITLDAYLNQQLNTERDNLVTVLRKAQTQAFSNKNQAPHGVYIASDKYIIFEGDSFGSRQSILDEEFSKSPLINIGGLEEIVFSQITANPNTVGAISLSDGRKVLNIQINEEGAINW